MQQVHSSRNKIVNYKVLQSVRVRRNNFPRIYAKFAAHKPQNGNRVNI